MNKKTFGERVNNWLDEPEGQTFKAGKWRFWFLALIALSILNAVLTASIFGSSKRNFIGSISLAVGALVAWLCVGTLHYSDSRDARLARGVSVLDSIALCFVIAHFCFLLWAQGHLLTIQAQESEYKTSAAAYNEKAEKISIDNAKIAEAARQIAQEETKRAKIENDTVYQARKAAQAGAIVNTQRTGPQSIAPSLSTSPIELEKPEKPKETSAAFLMKWDGWIRATNFGELILAAVTLIFIRNRSAKFNSHARHDDDVFPSEFEVNIIEKQSPSRRENFTKKKDTAKTHESFDPEGLKRLREALKDISFRLRGFSFKSHVKDDAVWIRLMKANQGTQETIASAKAKLEILNDAIVMPRAVFRERLEKFLEENGFEIQATRATSQ
jgi:hypothetical protein